MKKIFTLFAALAMVMSMSAETYRYSGEKDGWKGSTMTVSSDGYYSYYGPVTGAHQFKIGTSANQWAYNHSFVSKGFNSTDITDLGDYGGDNAYCWSSKKHYILVYHPSTKINSSSKVKICASTFLPDDSESDLPEPEPEPAELTYKVTVPAGTKVCYINGDMTGWKFTEMTKVDDTHYTITIEGAKKDDGYKYASGSDWGYVEKDANGNEIGNRTYADGNDVVARWASVYDPDAVEQELTYNVTVPAGTYACYIAMDSDPAKDGWEFTAMTKVDETHYTFTRTGLKNKTYKYASGPSWDYVEKTSENGDVADRQWAENDVVAKWQAVYDPTPIYTVNVTAENGTVTGAGKHKEGATATLTATAAEGYEFVKWTKGEEVVSTENPYTFTVTADVVLVANFKKSVVTITKSFDLTPENVGNRLGRQTISVEDVDLGSVQLIIPGFSTEVTEYAEASLAIGDDEPLTATATYQNDTENNKEIYTAVATSTDGSKIYKFTFNVALPTIQNYELYAMGISATVESEEGLTTYYLKGNAILGEEYVPVEFMLDNSGYAEGTIGEVFAVGTGEAEQEGTSLYGAVLLQDESGNTYRIEFTAEVEQPEVEIVVKEEVNVALYNLTVDVQGTMAMVSAGTEELSFWLTLLQTENHYGDYMNDDFGNIWYGDEQLYAAYGEKHTYGVTDGKVNFVVSFITSPDAEGNVTKYNFTLYAGEKPSDPTALDNISIEGKAAKAIINGQLIIVKDGVQYNAQGAVIK